MAQILVGNVITLIRQATDWISHLEEVSIKPSLVSDKKTGDKGHIQVSNLAHMVESFEEDLDAVQRLLNELIIIWT